MPRENDGAKGEEGRRDHREGGGAASAATTDLAVGTTTTTTTDRRELLARRRPIGSQDAIEVEGRYLVHSRTRERFLLRGIAFPTPPESRRAVPKKSRSPGEDANANEDATPKAEGDAAAEVDDAAVVQSFQDEYNPDGWIAVLEQVAQDLEINAVRMYRMDCRVDYSRFLDRAAQLGIYVIFPLTSSRGVGVLGRDLPPPECYPADLYRYGALCVDAYSHHPNVLAGMIGNEVMNNLLTWKSAPCVRAYARDLKLHMARRMKKERAASGDDDNDKRGDEEEQDSTSANRREVRARTTPHHYRALPLLYAAQHDSPDASVLPEAAMELTASYLTCVEGREDDSDNASATSTSVDMYGINVESWCSSLQTFEANEDGSEPGYHALYRTFLNASFPLVFSETGCSRILFNRDNGLPRYARDWRQVPVILNDMSPVLSGFCAYTYDGNPLFRMMGGGGNGSNDGNGSTDDSLRSISAPSWDGVHVMSPSPDYENFRSQLRLANQELASKSVASASGPAAPRLSCEDAAANLKQVWNLDLVPIHEMPSYVDTVVPWTVPKRRESSDAAATSAPGSSPPLPDEPEVFPGQGGMSGAKASLATMLAGCALSLLCTCLSHRRRRRLGRTGSSSADAPNRRGDSPQQVSLLQRSEEHREAKSYGAI